MLDMLVDFLIEKQLAERLSDTEFARKLGISRALWDFIRTGRRGFGEKSLKGIVRAFPELTPRVLLYLQGEDEVEKKKGER